MRQNIRILSEASTDRHFAVDTTFVLFFLALDLGLSLTADLFSGILSALTLVAFVVLPYLLPADGQKPGFGGWAAGRTLIALFALASGAMLKQTIGGQLPTGFEYLPMTLLIVSGMVCCYIQFFSVMRLRLAK